MSYVYAQNITIDEALPLIPPLSGSSSLQLNVAGIQSKFIVDWATKQSRISTSSMLEDITEGFAVYHLSFSKKWSKERITTTLNFRNLTDELYHTHTSIGNIPSEGFSVMAGLSFNLN
jgi:outer membrane receptor protein involved in Fe transport